MGTRSIVYARTEQGVRGVYCHWDGHPDSKLHDLHTLIARDGVSRVVCTLLGRPSGWSHLDAEQGSELRAFEDDGRFEAIPGYGVQYTDTLLPDPLNPETAYRQGDERYRDTSVASRDIWIEWLYVIEPDGTISYAENLPAQWADLDWLLSTGELT